MRRRAAWRVGRRRLNIARASLMVHRCVVWDMVLPIGRREAKPSEMCQKSWELN